MILILCALLNFASDFRALQSSVPKEVPATERMQQPGPIRAKKSGDSLVVKGPCGKKPCCQPIQIKVPEGKVLSPKIGMTLSVAPDGSVQKVEITASSNSPEVDQQLQAGASRWCMDKTKEGRDISITILIDLDSR